MQVRDALLQVETELNAFLLERFEAIRLAMCALISGENLLMLGKPGIAKSMLIRELCRRITGGIYWEKLFSKTTTPEEVFGPMDLQAFERGEYRRCLVGSLVSATIGFGDEIWKSNSTILNGLLTLLNEHLYHEAGQVYQTNMLTFFGASNELPEDSSLDALYDRFALRLQVHPLASDDNRLSLWLPKFAQQSVSSITLDQINQARAEVAMLPITRETQAKAIEIFHELTSGKQSVYVSDRRFAQAAKLIRARAYMAGAVSVEPEHLDILAYSWWNKMEDIPITQQIVFAAANPLHLEAIEIEDMARSLYDQRPVAGDPDLTKKLSPILQQLDDMVTELTKKIDTATNGSADRARETQARIVAWHRELSQLAMKAISGLRLRA